MKRILGLRNHSKDRAGVVCCFMVGIQAMDPLLLCAPLCLVALTRSLAASPVAD
jgi:hypothetical protein